MKKVLYLFTLFYSVSTFAQVDYSVEEIALDYQDLVNAANREVLFDGGIDSYDDDAVEIDLPFPFEFYGQAYGSLWVSTNGYLMFPGGENPYAWINAALPDAQYPNGVIAVFWDDLKVVNEGTTDQISYVVQGQAPNRVLIFDYRSVTVIGGGVDDDYIYVQAKLYEGSNKIELHYGPSHSDGGYKNATIGLEHPCGCSAVRGPNYLSDNNGLPDVAYRYTPVPEYYTHSEITSDYEDLAVSPVREILLDGSVDSYGDYAVQIDLPFPFEFYGQAYDSLWVSTNGYLMFPEGGDPYAWSNDILPAVQNPNGLIAVFWDDLLITNAGETDQISYVVQGQAPNRVLIIDYRSVTVEGSVNDFIYAQAKLYEGSYKIELHYGPSYSVGGFKNATIGLEHPCGCIADPGPNYDDTNDALPTQGYRYVPYDLIFRNGFGGVL